MQLFLSGLILSSFLSLPISWHPILPWLYHSIETLLHELPSTEIVKSGTTRLTSGIFCTSQISLFSMQSVLDPVCGSRLA